MFYVTCRGDKCFNDISVKYSMIGDSVKCTCGSEYIVDYDEFYDSETGDEECVWYLKTKEEHSINN